MSVEVEDTTLTTGCIREILLKRNKPKYPLIVQILETKMFQNKKDIHYDMYVSDGDLGFIFSNDVKYNQRHSTGQLSVFTIIKIIRYDVEFTCSSFESEVTFFEIIANGRDVKRIIGQPSNLPIEMRLNLYTIRLEKEIVMEKEAAKLELKCLNSATNISELSTGSLQKICYGTKIENPIFQILSLLKITNAEENLIYYSIDISDGKTSFYRVETQSFHFNNLVAAGFIKRFSIIRFDRYKLFDNDTRINLTHVTVINKDVELQIGENLKPAKLRNVVGDYRLRDRLLKHLRVSSSNKDTVLDAACLCEIQRGVAYTNPVLQIVKMHCIGSTVPQCTLEISDGGVYIFTENLNIPLLNSLLIHKNVNNSIVRIEEYELSFVRDTTEQYKPILHILKLKFITDPNTYTPSFAEPQYVEVSIPISHKDYNDFEEPSPFSKLKKTLPEKSLFKKGFLCKPPNKVETQPKDITLSDQTSDQTEKELQEKICALTLQLEAFEESKVIAIENEKLKKKLESIKKNFSIKAQKLIENNLEITGVQQKPNEDLKEIIDRIFTFVSISLNIDVDVTVSRNGHEIVIKCKNIATKKLILDRMRGKDLNSEELCLNIPKRKIFINEQLTPLNKIIYLKAKALRDNGVFNFVLIRNGKVFVKTKSHGNKLIHICSMDQMREYSDG